MALNYSLGQQCAVNLLLVTSITHLWHAIEPQTICHLIVKYKVAEQHF